MLHGAPGDVCTELVLIHDLAEAVRKEEEDGARALQSLHIHTDAAGHPITVGPGLAFPPCPKCQGISFYV